MKRVFQDDVVIVFKSTGAEIKHGVDVREYQGRSDVLINTRGPKRVPPHLWVKQGNSVGVISEFEYLRRQTAPRSPIVTAVHTLNRVRLSPLWIKFIQGAAVGTIASYLLRIL